MLSEKQLEANRINSQKSTGPVTPAGKQRSRLNAFRHGGCSRIMTEEEMQAFQSFTTSLIQQFKPANPVEDQLASSYATLQWRINRIAGIEDTLFTFGEIQEIAENLNIADPRAHTTASNAKTYLTQAQTFDRLSMYGQRLMNQAAKVLQQLKQLQQERASREEIELRQALPIYRAHKQAGAIFEPQKNGFVLTLAQIEAYLYRKNLENPDFITEEVEKAHVKAA
jgi:hypothetical protein